MNAALVKNTVESLFDNYVKDLEFLTNIDSVTGNIENSRKIAVWLEEKIKALGGTAEVRDNGRGAHVIARFKGKGKKRLLLVVHTDTVMGTENGNRLFKMDENKIAYGAGVGDCKASAVQMLYLVDAMNRLDMSPYSEITVFFDAEEEGGSADEVAFAKELAAASDYAVICDTGRPRWGVCTKRKATARYTIEIEGIQGHAGNAPQASANAVAEAGYLITKIHKLATPLTEDPNKYSSETLAKQGIMDHGQFIPEISVNIAFANTTNTKMNIIPGNAVVGVEVRCYKLSDQQRLDGEIREICKHPTIMGTKIKLSGGMGQGPMEKNEAAAKLFDMYKDIVKKEYNADVVEWIAGGLTIGNTTSIYVPTIDALGVEIDPMCEHSLKEWTDLKTFAPRTVALIHLIYRADEQL